MPALCVTKDWSLYAFLEGETRELKLDACELMGFNVGSFVLEKADDPSQQL